MYWKLCISILLLFINKHIFLQAKCEIYYHSTIIIYHLSIKNTKECVFLSTTWSDFSFINLWYIVMGWIIYVLTFIIIAQILGKYYTYFYTLQISSMIRVTYFLLGNYTSAPKLVFFILNSRWGWLISFFWFIFWLYNQYRCPQDLRNLCLRQKIKVKHLIVE